MSTGMDGIPCMVVKSCARCFVRPLKAIFNYCLMSGTVPTIWKLAKVCPILKSGDNMNVKNYRPISIIPVFAKLVSLSQMPNTVS
ncbi:GSCOCG00007236001-RA-CDS [Cotesia congregata]|nr:GSCOCG00007236001-RA-CDS [Cotesia congregata]